MPGPSVGAEGPYDFILQDRRVNPTVELGLVLAVNEERGGDGNKRWAETRARTVPPRRSSGPLSFTHLDPQSDFEWSQDSWESGALQPYYRDQDPARYATANNIDARWDGVFALGPRRGTARTPATVKARIQNSFLLSNPDFEEGATSGWTAGTGSTLSLLTTPVQAGTYACQVVVADATAAGDIMYQDLANPTVYRSREITVIAYLRRDAGTDSGVVLRIADSAGSTDSSAVTTDAYTYVSATRTINSGATSLRISIRHNTLTAAEHTFRVDSIAVVPTGGVECAGQAIRASTSPDDLYMTFGRVVTLWNETNFAHEAVYIDDSATATAIIEFNDIIYVAFGEPTSGPVEHGYIYGTGTSWTKAAINATDTHHDNHARFWVKARTGFGEWALWKAGPITSGGTERHGVFWATDPQNTGAWNPSSAFKVGSSGRNITGLYPFRDSFIVAKVDGVWLWDGTISDFVNVSPEWEHSVDEENGSRGQMWSDDLYLSSIRQGFHVFDGTSLHEISPLLMAPRLTDFGGRITAMTAGARELIIGLDTPTADTTVTKTSRLGVLNVVNKRLRLHILSHPNIALIDAMGLHRNLRLWVVGRTYNSDLSDYVPAMHMYLQGDKVAAPYADLSPDIESTGYIETSIWHGGVPGTPKALWALTLWTEDLDETHTVRVDFGIDGLAANTSLLGTLNESERIQTLYFADLGSPVDDAQGRFIQLRFTLTTDDNVSPKVYAFSLHTILAPEPVPVWNLFAYVGGGTALRSGVPAAESKSQIEGLFGVLEDQVFPLVLTENFGQSHGGVEEGGASVHYVRLRDFARVPNSIDDRGQELYFLRLQEVPVGRTVTTE
jgi:hypothetical protein